MIERDKVEAALERKGFTVENDRDHRWFRYYHNGKKTPIATKTSRGTKYKDLGDDLERQMAKQLFLTKPQFRALVECTLSGEAYLALMQEQRKV